MLHRQFSPAQKMYFSPSCTVRGPPVPPRADCTMPKLALFRLLVGLFRFTQLKALKLSRRTWMVELLAAPPAVKFLKSDRSKFLKPGPRNAFPGVLRPGRWQGSGKSFAVNTPATHCSWLGFPRSV